MADEFIGLNGESEKVQVSPDSGTLLQEPSVEPEISKNKKEPGPKASTPAHTIEVNLTDRKSPIILLFGPQSSGKTMTLVRLAQYLRPKGYQLMVDANFCDNAWEYEANMINFNKMLGTNFALKGTGRNDFLLVKILDRQGNTKCQILEGAGEDYFPSTEVPGYSRSKVPFPAYMTHIFNAPNKKVWMFITEPNWLTSNDRFEYVERIKFCKDRHFGQRDKCIIVYNKIDNTPFCSGEKVNVKASIIQCNNEYQGIFDLFPNTSPLPSFLREPYACKYVPFSTGTYGISVPNHPAQYVPSKDIHPARLWDAIISCINS